MDYEIKPKRSTVPVAYNNHNISDNTRKKLIGSLEMSKLSIISKELVLNQTRLKQKYID